MRASTARRFAPLAAAAVLVFPAAAQLVAAVTSAPPAAASTLTVTVPAQQGYQEFQGDSYNRTATFSVPPAVTRVIFVAVGGSGGGGGTNGVTLGGNGGNAALVTGAVNVTPGQTFDLYLGPAGFNASSNPFQKGFPGPGGGESTEDNHGAFGGSGDGNSGSGGGGGAATAITTNGTLVALAGGGGGGGGAGGLAGYVGGPGGNAGPGATGGTGGTGPGAGGGGGIVACAATGNQHAGTVGHDANSASTGGGGGGGGAGYSGANCGGSGGSGGGSGAGGGGGGGAGASYYDSSRVLSPDYETNDVPGNGSVLFRWTPPQSSVSLAASSYAATLHLVAHVAPQGVSSPAPTGTVDFSETPDGVSEMPLGSATVDAQGNATLVTSKAVGGIENFIARYEGDDTFAASSTFVAYTYAQTPVTPAIQAGPDSNPAQWYTSGSLHATITPPSGAPTWATTPTGTVTFTDITDAAAHQYTSTQPLAADGTVAAPIVWNSTGTYTFRADYSGDANYRATSTTFDVVSNATAPIANAGADQTTTSGTMITIDGSGSSDPQRAPLSYDWEQLDGPAATITDNRRAITTVKLPTTNTKVVVHLQLTVTNGAGLSSSSILGITVNPK